MKNNNKGFTLVEMIVSFVILLIIVSMGMVGVLAYQDFADYKRQNNYAQTLFVAAQSKLTAYSVRGGLEELQEMPGEELFLDTIITPDGKPASRSGKADGTKKSTIYYLTGTKDTYAKYQAGEYENKTDPESKGYQILYDIFDEYLMDKTILDAAISLEYNPKEGLVYGVLYSDKNASFTYTAINKNGRVNICDRRQDYRSEYLIGYYGLD